jgi:hypothetical protein
MSVILPEIHDGELRRIDIPGDDSLTLTFETINREVRTITLEGVEHFRCDNLLQGNIVFDIQRIEDPSLDDLARVTGMDSAVSEKGRGHLRDKQLAVRQGELQFLTLRSSYGCSLAVLCRGCRDAGAD